MKVKTNCSTESGEEVLECKWFGARSKEMNYSAFFSSYVDEQLIVGKEMWKRLKKRQRIREEVTR